MFEYRKELFMKLSKMIDIINFNKNIPFIEYNTMKNDKNTLMINEKGIYYWEETDISSFETFDDTNHYRLFSKKISDNFNGISSNKEKEIYYAVLSILHAIGTWKNKTGLNFNRDEYINPNTREYVNIVKEEIMNKLDFSQISNMKDLISIIKENSLYKYLLFHVNECNDSKKKLTFGNIKYYETLDVVNIDIYDDYIKLCYENEGMSHEFELNLRDKNKSVEEKIIFALYNWRDYFYN